MNQSTETDEVMINALREAHVSGNKDEIAEALRKLMRHQNWNSVQLSRLLDCAEATVCRWLQEKTLIKRSTINKIEEIMLRNTGSIQGPIIPLTHLEAVIAVYERVKPTTEVFAFLAEVEERLGMSLDVETGKSLLCLKYPAPA